MSGGAVTAPSFSHMGPVMGMFLLAGLLAILAAPATAQITARDVIDNHAAFLRAIGADLNVTLDDGIARDATATRTIFEYGPELRVTFSEIALAENADGTVTITWPGGLTIRADLVGAGVFDEAEMPIVSLDIALTPEGHQVIASGRPGDIVYDGRADRMRMRLIGADTSDLPAVPDTAYDYDATDWRTEVRITQGDPLVFDYGLLSGPTEAVDTAPSWDWGMTDITTTSTGGGSLAITATLPAGMWAHDDPLTALRDGLVIGVTSDYTASVGRMITTDRAGTEVYSDESLFEREVFAARLDATGLALRADIGPGHFGFRDAYLSDDEYSTRWDTARAEALLPVLAGPDPQPARLSVLVEGATGNDAVWALAPGTEALPRDPARLELDSEALVTLDTTPFEMLVPFYLDPLPIAVDSVTLTTLDAAIAGATLQADGAVAFDWTDTDTWGFAAPTGRLTATATGLTALLDALDQGGTLPPEAIRAARMGLALFAQPTGDDTLSSEVEISEDGQLIVNGQRMQ